jgi:hypothetical protein
MASTRGRIPVAALETRPTGLAKCRYQLDLEEYISIDQNLTNLYAVQLRRDFRSSRRAFSTYLSTEAVGISKMSHSRCLLRSSCDHESKEWSLSD